MLLEFLQQAADGLRPSSRRDYDSRALEYRAISESDIQVAPRSVRKLNLITSVPAGVSLNAKGLRASAKDGMLNALSPIS